MFPFNFDSLSRSPPPPNPLLTPRNQHPRQKVPQLRPNLLIPLPRLLPPLRRLLPNYPRLLSPIRRRSPLKRWVEIYQACFRSCDGCFASFSDCHFSHIVDSALLSHQKIRSRAAFLPVLVTCSSLSPRRRQPQHPQSLRRVPLRSRSLHLSPLSRAQQRPLRSLRLLLSPRSPRK